MAVDRVNANALSQVRFMTCEYLGQPEPITGRPVRGDHHGVAHWHREISADRTLLAARRRANRPVGARLAESAAIGGGPISHPAKHADHGSQQCCSEQACTRTY